MTEQEITNEEREAVGIIQALLTLNGESEPESVSLTNWRNMDATARRATYVVYDILCGSIQ